VLVKEAEDAIAKVLNRVLKTLKTYYTDGEPQVYLCISSGSAILNGLNSGHFSLKTPVKDLVNTMDTILQSFLRSHENMLLTDDFKINAKVISVPHVEEKMKKGFKPHIYKGRPGAPKGKRPALYDYVLEPPVGFPEDKNIFSDCCLIISLILGHFYNAVLTNGDEKQCNSYKQCLTKDKDFVLKSSKAGKMLKEEINKTLAMNEIDQKDKHNMDLVIPKVMGEFQSQVHIFSLDHEKYKIHSHPIIYNAKLPQIYLVRSETETENIYHIQLITDFEIFQKKNGYYCFHCEKRQHSTRGKNHSCSKIHMKEKCFACRRKIWADEWLSSQTKNLFCVRQDNNSGQLCEGGCQYVIRGGPDCLERHLKKCKETLYCSSCKKLLHINGERNTREKIKERHICSEKQCFFCRQYYVPDPSNFKLHCCPLRQSRYQKDYTNLGFISTQWIVEQAEAEEETTEKLIYAACLIEEEKRGNFGGHFFSDDNVKTGANYIPEAVTDIDSTYKMPSELTRLGRPSRYNSRLSSKFDPRLLKEKSTPCVMEKVMRHIIIQNKTFFRNSSFFVHGQQDMVRKKFNYGIKKLLLKCSFIPRLRF